MLARLGRVIYIAAVLFVAAGRAVRWWLPSYKAQFGKRAAKSRR